MKRRKFLFLSTVAASSLLLGRNFISDTSKNSFTNRLHIPPLLDGKNINGVYHYDLSIQKAKHQFFQNKLTDTYAINATYLAPTLRLIDGQEVSINYTNNLDVVTTMHGHGMHLPANMDGSPHQSIKPKDSWSARYRVNQRACTNWYHPHAHKTTAQQVYKGLAGLIIIEDKESQSLDLPKEYGVDDIPLVLQDRYFDSNAQILYNPGMREIMMGYKGDTFVTNGVINPVVTVEAKEIRLRLLNGSNSSVYNLKFDDSRVFHQIATDNSFLETPVSLNSLRLSPGERAEIVVDLTTQKGQTLYLMEYQQNKAFVKFDITQSSSTKTQLPKKLTTLVKYKESQAVNRRTFTLSAMMGQMQINAKSMSMHRIDEKVPLNQVEIWEVHNERMMMDMAHNFHIHGTHFMVLERNGSAQNVLESEKGYKDTVYLAAGDRVKLIVKMTDYTDKTTPYMYHCHFLEHEDRGMMGQFTVS